MRAILSVAYSLTLMVKYYKKYESNYGQFLLEYISPVCTSIAVIVIIILCDIIQITHHISLLTATTSSGLLIEIYI